MFGKNDGGHVMDSFFHKRMKTQEFLKGNTHDSERRY